MLSRPATTICLTPEDIVAYEQRKMARDTMRERAEREQQQLLDSSQDSSGSTVEDESNQDLDATPAQQTRAAKVKAARDQRIGVGGSSRS